MTLSALSQGEIDNIRFHLGYGSINIGAYPYTPDGFYELFTQVIAPNLSTGEETTSSTAVVAAGISAITPAAMTGIANYARLVVDVGESAEIVTVRSVTGSTFSALFANPHPTGYPIAVLSGVSRARMLLQEADRALERLNSDEVGAVSGLKKVDEIEWYEGLVAMQGRAKQYGLILSKLSSLLMVPRAESGRGSGQLEAY